MEGELCQTTFYSTTQLIVNIKKLKPQELLYHIPQLRFPIQEKGMLGYLTKNFQIVLQAERKDYRTE